MNRKRIQRLWREEGLRVPGRRRKRQRRGDSTTAAAGLRAGRPNEVWALDFQFDQTADGRLRKLLNVVDEYTREALAVVTQSSITADATVATLERLVAQRGTAPRHVRCDHGPELTAHAPRDWCRSSGAGASYIKPGSPWENPYAGGDRGLESRVQHAASAQQPRLAQPGCLRRALEGAANRRSCDCRSGPPGLAIPSLAARCWPGPG